MENRSLLPYTDYGGVMYGQCYLGSMNWSFPLAQLSLNDSSAEIKILWFKKFLFAPGDIQKIELFNGIFSKGIRIIHNRKDYPPFIVFWSFSGVDFWKAMFNKAGFDLPC